MTLDYNTKSSIQQVLMVCELQHNLMGLPANKDLEIITGINAVKINVLDQYRALFNELGTFKEESVIKCPTFLSLYTKKYVNSIKRESLTRIAKD